MIFEIEKRNETARKGWIEFKGKRIEIPLLLGYKSQRIHLEGEIELGSDIKGGGTFFYPSNGDIPPVLPYPHFFPTEFHEFVSKWNEENSGEFYIADAMANIKKDDKIYVLQNARELYANPRNFVEAMVEVRKKIGYKPLYAPAIATPYNLPLLVYAGIDIIDVIELILKSRKGIYFSPEERKLEEIKEYPCSCKYCMEGIDKFEHLLMHNYTIMKNEMAKVKNEIENGSIRRIVEGRAAEDAHMATILRLLDEKYEHFEKRWPVGGNKINASCYSLNMPPIKRFRERIIERYHKPEIAKILLLLPCSAKKPYSLSKSHILFRKVINRTGNKNVIHEVIITSPLGIVPREIENFYPAAHYDISVTGYWNREEREMLREMMEIYLEKNKYDIIINHLPDEIDFLEIDSIRTCIDKPTSHASLKNLEKTLHEIVEEYDYIYPSWRRRDDIKSMISFQFGCDAKNFENCKIKGKFPDYKIYCNEKQAGVYIAKRGMFSLTLIGARLLGRNYWVEIHDFIPKGSIFAAGVADADARIRAGDEVVFYHDGKLIGVGVAKMNGEEMVESKKGEAIRVRHHI